jgi:hypothetical protein
MPNEVTLRAVMRKSVNRVRPRNGVEDGQPSGEGEASMDDEGIGMCSRSVLRGESGQRAEIVDRRGT